jgi:hypothetical protein
MPCVILPLDPTLGPLIEFGVSFPSSLLKAGAPHPKIVWLKAIADTGCTRTAIHTTIAAACGLVVRSKSASNAAGGPLSSNVYHADIFLRVPLTTGQIVEHPFRDRMILELPIKLPEADALFGMDILSLGTFHVNGLTKEAAFCW